MLLYTGFGRARVTHIAPTIRMHHMLEPRLSHPLQKGHARSTQLCAIFGAMAVLCGTGAFSADTTPVEDTGGPLQEITVTAHRHEESLSKVPLSVTALTQDTMNIRG